MTLVLFAEHRSDLTLDEKVNLQVGDKSHVGETISLATDFYNDYNRNEGF